MDWTIHFEDYILERGYRYFRDGKVRITSSSDEQARALVEGSRAYTVVVNYARSFIDFSCTCPQAKKGYWCKHMAALGYAWEAHPDYVDPVVLAKAKRDRQLAEIGRLIDAASPEVVRSFLSQLLFNDDQLVREFKLASQVGLDKDMVKYYTQKAKNLIKSMLSSHDDYYEYDDVSDYDYDVTLDPSWATERDLKLFLTEDIPLLVEKGQIELAWKLTTELYQAINRAFWKYDREFSAGDELNEAWQSVHAEADDGLIKQMFDFFVERAESEGEGAAADYLFHYFQENHHLERKLLTAQASLPEPEFSLESRISPSEIWPIRTAWLMEQLGRDDEAIEQLLKTYSTISPVRIYFADYLVRRNQVQRAIRLLEEGRHQPYPAEAKTGFQKAIVRIYHETGDDFNYRNEIYQLVKNYTRNDLTTWRELRALYPVDEWRQVRARLIDDWPEEVDRIKIYDEEDMLAELLEEILNSSYWTFQRYEDRLKPIYPKELLSYLKQTAQEMSDHISNRKDYQQLANLYHHIEDYPGGDEVVQELIASLRGPYRNRPALWDELKRFTNRR